MQTKLPSVSVHSERESWQLSVPRAHSSMLLQLKPPWQLAQISGWA